MAFLVPNVLIPIDFEMRASVDNVTDFVLGYIQFDCELFYIEYRVLDANNTYDETLVTLEYDVSAGADTVIDAITVPAAAAASAGVTQIDRDSITTTRIPAGARILLTAADVTTGADTAILIRFWAYPVNV